MKLRLYRTERGYVLVPNYLLPPASPDIRPPVEAVGEIDESALGMVDLHRVRDQLQRRQYALVDALLAGQLLPFLLPFV